VRFPGRSVCALTLVALAAFCISCGSPSSEPVNRKIMLLGIDGLEWDILGPMLETGRLPNFQGLIQRGAWGEVQSLDILESPVIWTSVATGKIPEKHGVMGFVKYTEGRDDPTPVTSNVRRVKTVWNILGERSVDVGIVGWLATWPAEPVNGYLVTSYFHYPEHPGHDLSYGVSFPEKLADDLVPFRTVPGDVTDAEVATFLRGPVPEAGEPRRRADKLKEFIAFDATSRAVGLRMAEVLPVSFFSVYFRAVDGPCHMFWGDAFPESVPPERTGDPELFGDVIARYYERMDSILGEYLELVDDETTVIVMSDHGHSGPKKLGKGYTWGITMHDPTGVIFLAGRDIVSGRELSEPNVLDVTPTLLALFGLPVADDMDGRVLTEAIEPAFLRAHPVTSVATYEDSSAGAGEEREPIESSVDEAVRERLRSLGYIE
jgi:predicted AlkP superfamily phosphohydrolase/phosphomutase